MDELRRSWVPLLIAAAGVLTSLGATRAQVSDMRAELHELRQLATTVARMDATLQAVADQVARIEGRVDALR